MRKRKEYWNKRIIIMCKCASAMKKQSCFIFFLSSYANCYIGYPWQTGAKQIRTL